MQIEIDLDKIADKESFHTVFAETFGFFEGYGRNMDAWIDCMGELRTPQGESITRTTISSDETLMLLLRNTERFKKRCPPLWEALIDCAAFVNFREAQLGLPPLLALAYYE